MRASSPPAISLGRLRILSLTFALGLLARGDAPAQAPKAKEVAPGDTVIIDKDRTGAYFIARPLKEKYDSIQKRVAGLKDDIRHARLDSAKANALISGLQAELKSLLGEINATRRYIPGAVMQTRVETTTIPLAAEELVLIACENVEIVGWDGPGIECRLEKTVLDEDGTKFDADLAGIRVDGHKRAVGEFFRMFGNLTRIPSKNAELERLGFLKEAGRGFTFITVKGLMHDQGNRQIQLEMKSERGDGMMSSQWRRHAKLTLKIPHCRLVGVQGALGGFRVRDLHAPLLVEGQGNRDYSARYSVSNLIGPLIAENISLHEVEGIRGDVVVLAEAYGEDRSSGYDSMGKTDRPADPKPSHYREIRGELKARFCRADLALDRIEGRIDVENDFGSTEWRIDRKLAQGQDHRLVTQSGTVAIRLDEASLGSLTTSLFTECGIIHLAEGINSFKNTMFDTVEGDTTRRSWVSETRNPADVPGRRPDPLESFAMFRRPADALYGRPRKPGVDVVSRAGTITVSPLKAGKPEASSTAGK